MAYVDPNYKTKKAFKEAVQKGIEHYPYVAGGMFSVPRNGSLSIEGPHYPQPHRWYAAVTVVDGIVTKVR
jgi:hypothetical protein